MSLAVFSCTIPIFDFGPGGLELASLIIQLERKRRAGGRIFFRPAKSVRKPLQKVWKKLKYMSCPPQVCYNKRNSQTGAEKTQPVEWQRIEERPAGMETPVQRKKLNLGIVAHADAGKTTLTEQILYLAGAVRAAGSVDDGTASTDTLAVERERGISVRTACASVFWKGVKLNLIDAPGHSDFLSEVERSLSVLDAAVLVISSVEGIQPQTRQLAESLKNAGLPCLLFFNKCDRAGSRSAAVLQEAEKLFGKPVLPLNAVLEEGTERCAVQPLSLTEGERLERSVLACAEEPLLELLLTSEEEAARALPEALGRAVGEARVLPALFGASKYGTGVGELLDAAAEYLQEAEAPGGEFCARVYKVEHDPIMGKAAYVRLFSGSLRNRQAVRCAGETEEKVTRIRCVSGKRLEDAEQVEANDIAVLYGLSSVRSGDVLGTAPEGLREYRLCEPLMLAKAEPENPEQQRKLVEALQLLCEEDPSLQLEWNREKQEAWIRVTGRIQLEVLEGLLMERWGLRVSFGKPSVIYRETPRKCAEGFEAYLAPKPCWAVVKFMLEPLPRGSGVQYESKVSPGRLPYLYQAHVETALFRALSQGLHGWEVTDMKVTLTDGESHHVHTHPLDFFVATPMALMDGLRAAGTKLLEPIVRLQLDAPEEYLGKTISLLTAHRGVFESPELRDGYFCLTALVPAAETFDFPVEFAVATAGKGSCGSRFSHYEDCPEGMGEERERLGPDPLDRPRFILAARSALTQGD